MTKLTIRFVLIMGILWIFPGHALAQVSRFEPEQPRWGQTLTIKYETSVEGARFTIDDDVYLTVRLSFPGGGETVSGKMTRAGNQFRYDLKLRDNLSAVAVHFITLNGGWDEQAYATSMVYRADGKPARGAYESKINSGRYQEFFSREVALYPDNFSAYRAKWSMALAVDGEKAVGAINAEIRQLSGRRVESAELLSSLSFGHISLGRERESRELIKRLFDKYPDSPYTSQAISDYEAEIAGRGLAANIPADVQKIKSAMLQDYPATEFARRQATQWARDERAPLGVIEKISQSWIAAEPENPQPYFTLALAYQNRYQNYTQAAPLIEKAITFLNEGRLRFYGDVNGRLGQQMLGAAYLVQADLAFRQGQYPQALKAIRTAEAFDQDPRFAAYLLEAKIWNAQGQHDRSEAAFIEAWARGSQEAEERLKARYKERLGNLQGFDEYLLAASRNGNPENGSGSSRKPSPEFKLSSLDGMTFDLNALQGKIVVLNLWFIACGPCRREIPKLNQIVKEFKNKNVVFIAPSFDQADTLRGFIKRTPFDYHIVADAEEFIIGKFNAKSFPTHIVIDQSGQIETMLVGDSERRPEEIRRVLLQLLNSQSSQN